MTTDNKMDLALNNANDIDLNNTTGSFNTVSGLKELMQKIYNALNINLGEIPWNDNVGINQNILLNNAKNPTNVNSIIRSYFRQLFGSLFVNSKVIKSHLDTKNRVAKLTLTARFIRNGEPMNIQSDLKIGGDWLFNKLGNDRAEFNDIHNLVKNMFIAEFGSSIDLDDPTVASQLAGIYSGICDKLAKLFEGGVNSLFITSATGSQLDDLGTEWSVPSDPVIY